MEPRRSLRWWDLLFVACAACFFLGCVATSYRSGKALDRGQFSAGGSYLSLDSSEDEEYDVATLLTVDARIGVTEGGDIGLAHSWDTTSGGDGVYSTWWGDLKWQVTDEKEGMSGPLFTTGLIKGYVYHEEGGFHITSIPFTLSRPATQKITPFATYRLEFAHEDFFPTNLENIRHALLFGSEFDVGDPAGGGWTPMLGFSVGWMNSLLGGEGDGIFVLNFGVGVKSPGKPSGGK